MWTSRATSLLFGLLAATLLLVVGCQTLHNAGLPGLESFLKRDTQQLAFEQSKRDQFVLERDHKALFWLLANRIENGMNLADVEMAMGEPGELETGMGHLKTGGLYQTTDLAYKWGPDLSGYTAILFFRDGKIVNFNPKEYRNFYTARGPD